MEKMKITFNRLLYVGAAFAAMSLAAIAQAGTLASGAPLYGDSVTINYQGVDNSTAAGAFVDASFNGGAIPPFWCIDLTHTVPYPPWSIDGYTESAFVSGTFTGTQVSNLDTLFANNYSNALFTNADDAAAFQLAIWDILFDTDSNLSSYIGNGGSAFGVVSSSIAASVVSEAQGWTTTAETGTQSPYALTELVSSTGNQNFIFPSPPTSKTVPEPTGLALLGAGLVAMMFVTRRRRTNGHWA
jgi:hypothetical protein